MQQQNILYFSQVQIREHAVTMCMVVSCICILYMFIFRWHPLRLPFVPISLSLPLRLAEASVVRISVLFVRRRCFCCFSAFQKFSVRLSVPLSAYLSAFRFSRFYPALPLVAWTTSVVKLALMCSRL